MKIQIGRGAEGSNTRMEAELTKWLRGFEPAGTPIAVRLRTFADLREEAAHPRPRLRWLMPALASMASLGAIVFGAGLVMLLAIVSASVGHVAGGPAPVMGPYVGGQTGLPWSNAQDWAPYVQRGLDQSLILVLVASALAGLSVFLPRVRTAARLIAMGRAGTAPAAALPFRRPLRSIPRATWALAALGLVLAAWTLWLVSQPGWTSPEPWARAIGLGLLPITVSVPAVVAWRYPLSDRSSKLLLLGTTATLLTLLLVLFEVTFNVYQVPDIGGTLGDLETWAQGIVAVTASVALAAGLACRTGSVRRPPSWLAAVAIGGAFFIEMGPFFDTLSSEPDWGFLSTWFLSSACRWLELVGMLAVLWVGISAWRRHGGSSGWRLVLVAGAFQLIARLPGLLLYVFNGFLVYYTPFGAAGMGDPSTVYAIAQWASWCGYIATTALVLALITGLRPAAAITPPTQPSVDAREGDAAAEPTSGGTPAV